MENLYIYGLIQNLQMISNRGIYYAQKMCLVFNIFTKRMFH